MTKTGQVAAILELGTGFHADYSGRENIYVGGLCLGLSRKQIDSRVAEVIEFSELEKFIDQPFRTYSSAMQARLAFSIATSASRHPDIDEALSVGDARFRLKSFDRIRKFKRRGESILVVSHSINQLASVCDRAILLDRGRILLDGSSPIDGWSVVPGPGSLAQGWPGHSIAARTFTCAARPDGSAEPNADSVTLCAGRGGPIANDRPRWFIPFLLCNGHR